MYFYEIIHLIPATQPIRVYKKDMTQEPIVKKMYSEDRSRYVLIHVFYEKVLHIGSQIIDGIAYTIISVDVK